MLRSPCRRLTDQVREALSPKRPGALNSDHKISGGNLLVAGTVRGNSKLSGILTLLHSGKWEGDVEAVNAVVAGHVDGNLTVTGKVEIRKSARIGGSVRAHTIAIADGAIIEGDVATTSDRPVIRFREKRRKTESLQPWQDRIRLVGRAGAKGPPFRI